MFRSIYGVESVSIDGEEPVSIDGEKPEWNRSQFWERATALV